MDFFVLGFGSFTVEGTAFGAAAMGLGAFAESCEVGAGVVGFVSCCETWAVLGDAGTFAASGIDSGCESDFSDAFDCAGATVFAADDSLPHAPSTKLAQKLDIDAPRTVAIEVR